MSEKKTPKVKIDVEQTPVELAAEEIAAEELSELTAEDAADTAVLPRELAEEPAETNDLQVELPSALVEEPAEEAVHIIVEEPEAEVAAEGEPEPEPDVDPEPEPAAPTPEPIPVMTPSEDPADAVATPAKPAPIVSFQWLSKHFPGHEHATLGCLFGLLVGIGVLTVGVWKTALVLVLMALGTEIGNCLDGSAGLISRLKRRSGKKE